MAKKRSVHGLGALQAEVMDIIWELGEATVTQVHERIGLRRKVMYTTVQVAMQKLAKRGWLDPRREGRANVYRPVHSRADADGRLLKDVLRQAFEGNPKTLLSSLLDEYPMSDEELADLRKLIERKRREKRRE